MELKIITRAEAKEQGLTHYFSGTTCSQGHISLKYTSNKKCLSCNRANVLKWQKNNPEKVAARSARANQRNPAYKLEANMRRIAKKLQATPTWLTAEQRKQLIQIYRDCPEGYHVDHIVPLRSDIVCGLHVPWNLSYLVAPDNIKKGNRHWPNMFMLDANGLA